MGVNLNKIINTGWTNLRRNSYLSFGATGMMALTLFLFLCLFSFQLLTSQVVASLQGKVDISAYFASEASENQILVAKDELSVLPEVEAVTYISQDQALIDFRQKHEDDELIQESLDELDFNPLAASLSIKAKDPSQYAFIVQFLEKSRFSSVIEKIDFYENRGVIERIHAISGGIRNWGMAGVLALALIAVLVTFNTIRLTIFNQRQEIEIMKLVGASNWQVRGPYVAEGGLYGLFAAFAALGVFYPVVYLASDKITAFVPDINFLDYFLVNAAQVIFLVVFLGVLMGVASSAIAIRKHLRV